MPDDALSGAPPETEAAPQPSPPPPHQSTPHGWALIALLVVSLLPLLFLKLHDASQLASALALPLAVVLAGLPSLPALRRSEQPLPWRRILVIGSIVVAVLGCGGVTYAVWQNTKDIPVTLAAGSGAPGHWTQYSSNEVAVPGNPPARSFVGIVVSLHNPDSTGDCERTAKVDFTPIVDGRPRAAVTDTVPGETVDVPIAGALRTVTVRITVHWAKGNDACRADLQIDRAILHD